METKCQLQGWLQTRKSKVTRVTFTGEQLESLHARQQHWPLCDLQALSVDGLNHSRCFYKTTLCWCVQDKDGRHECSAVATGGLCLGFILY